MLGHYHLRGEEMDETIALFFRAPHSYTGEDVIELSVHGGNAMAQGLLEALYLAGAAPAGPGEFTRRALENGRMSLTQAEAVMEIISAEVVRRGWGQRWQSPLWTVRWHGALQASRPLCKRWLPT